MYCARKEEKYRGVLKDEQPFDDALERLSDLISEIDDKQTDMKKGKLPDGVQERVNDIKNLVSSFKELTEESLRKAGVDPNKLLSPQSWKKDLPVKEQRVMEGLEGLKRELKNRRDSLTAQIEGMKAGKRPLSEEGQKEQSKKVQKKKKRARKRKFRGMGGDDWVKM